MKVGERVYTLTDVEILRQIPFNNRESDVARQYGISEAQACGVTLHLGGFDPKPGWRLGVVYGPSGAGKTCFLNHNFPDRKFLRFPCNNLTSVLAALPDFNVEEITKMFTISGFGSVPSWFKRFQDLSVGEQYRVMLARALLMKEKQLVLDEFGCALDKQTRIGLSRCLSHFVHKNESNLQIVISTPDESLIEYLKPDWLVDVSTGIVREDFFFGTSGRIDVYLAKQSSWRGFAQHHYLSHHLSRFTRCYVGVSGGREIAFAGLLRSVTKRPLRRISRVVILPDWQGCGLAGRFLDAIASIQKEEGYACTLTGSHPSIESFMFRTPTWKIFDRSKLGYTFSSGMRAKGFRCGDLGRYVFSAEYVGS